MNLSLNLESAEALREFAGILRQSSENIIQATEDVLKVYNSVSESIGLHSDFFLEILERAKRTTDAADESFEPLAKKLVSTAEQIETYVKTLNIAGGSSQSLTGNTANELEIPIHQRPEAPAQNPEPSVREPGLRHTMQVFTTEVINGVEYKVFDHPALASAKFAVVNQGSANAKYSGTCGLCASGTISNKILGKRQYSEGDVIRYAASRGLCKDTGEPKDRGGTTVRTRSEIVTGLTDEPTYVPYGSKLSDVARAVEEGYGVIIAVDAQAYGFNEAGGHAIVLESVVRSLEDNSIAGYYVIDSNGSTTGEACRFIDAKQLEIAYQRRGCSVTITENIIW